MSAGFTEAQIFSWSPGLVSSRLQLVKEMHDDRLADEATLNMMIAAVAAGVDGAADDFNGIIAELRRDAEASTDAHLLNPNAETDWDAVRTVATRVKVSPDPEADAQEA
jgi:hypothetical protein